MSVPRAASALERRSLYVTAVVRAVTTSLIGVLLGVHLARLGLGAASFGTIISSGLGGAALAAVVATFAGDRIGRRRLLMLLSGSKSLRDVILFPAMREASGD